MGSFFVGLTICLLSLLLLFLGFRDLMEILVGTPKALERGYRGLFSSIAKMVIGAVIALGFFVWVVFFSLPGPNLFALRKAISEKYNKEYPHLAVTGVSVFMSRDLGPDLCRVVVKTSGGQKQSFLLKFDPKTREILLMEEENAVEARETYESTH